MIRRLYALCAIPGRRPQPRVLSWGEGTQLHVGRDCRFGRRVAILLGGNHRIDWIAAYNFKMFPDEFPAAQQVEQTSLTKGDVHIGDRVTIGDDCIILSGITIGADSVVLAGSVVTKDVPPATVVGGNPARQIDSRH